MEKKCYANMKMFPNTIFIRTSTDGGKQFTFTSFLKNGRRHAYKLIKPFAVNMEVSPLGSPGPPGSTVVITSSDTSSHTSNE